MKTPIIAIGSEERFFSPIAASIAFAAEDLHNNTKIIKINNIFYYIYTPQIVAAPDIIIEDFLFILNRIPM